MNTSLMSTILFVGGGSVGHIAPSISVWSELKKNHPEMQAHFVCSPRTKDKEFLRQAGCSFTSIDAPRFGISFLWKFLSSYKKSRTLLKEKRPDVVFSKGGYVSVPVCLAAHHMNIPIIMHESDAVSGYANKLVSRWATCVCLGMKPDEKSVVSGQWSEVNYTGNPIRSEIMKGSREEGLRITNLSDDKPVLLILGGSQGALAINKIISEKLEELLKICNVVHITGEGKDTVNKNVGGYWSVPFAYTELPHLYALATIALSRAGAGSIAELAAVKIPTILVPLRGAGHDHQEKNARSIERQGGCKVLEQTELPQTLIPTVQTLLSNAEQRETLSSHLHEPQRLDSSTQIVEIISQVLARVE
jgi:UDP-N-acetylglucosamine--N-acetylmuramyl-(pentapeptide) pyrophosphoryl-undecaprenol N-acetylglucosamine transferase